MLEVIIIDDDQIVVFIQKKMITNQQIATNPISFKEAPRALEYIKGVKASGKKEFLILLDINMPEMNGWEFLEVLENHPEKNTYHVIMVTSSIDAKDKRKAQEFGTVRHFIEKPITTKDCKEIKEIPEIAHFF